MSENVGTRGKRIRKESTTHNEIWKTEKSENRNMVMKIGTWNVRGINGRRNSGSGKWKYWA